MELIEQGSAGRESAPAREALVQLVEITDDIEGAAHRAAESMGSTEKDVLASPYVWLGTAQQIVRAMARHEERWGITRYVVREGALEAAGQVMSLFPETD